MALAKSLPLKTMEHEAIAIRLPLQTWCQRQVGNPALRQQGSQALLPGEGLLGAAFVLFARMRCWCLPTHQPGSR